MELHEQIDAVRNLIDRLADAAAATAQEAAARAEAAAASTAAAGRETAAAQPQTAAAPMVDRTATESPAARRAGTDRVKSGPSAEPPQLRFERPAQNEIVLSLGEQAVKLGPADISAIIEELAMARASMTPEPPSGLPAGWRFVATQDPVMASQPRNNGSKLVVLRHTGYGWVPFTFTPKMIVELLAVLSAK